MNMTHTGTQEAFGNRNLYAQFGYGMPPVRTGGMPGAGWTPPRVQHFPYGTGPRTAMLAPPARVVRAVEKICVLGDSAVGKTSLVRRLAMDRFEEEYVTTVGANVLQKRIRLQYPEYGLQFRLLLQLWDVTGQKGADLNPAFFRGASGALVVGDAQRIETQIELWKWIERFRKVAGPVPVVLAVNKTDVMDLGAFDFLLMDDISAEYDCFYLLTSARTGERVESAFHMLCEHLVRTKYLNTFRGGRAC